MRRMIGFICFWIAVGMTIMLFLRHAFFSLLLIILLYFLSYWLFCKCWNLKRATLIASLKKKKKAPLLRRLYTTYSAVALRIVLRHEAHRYIFLLLPPTFKRTLLMLDFHILFVLRDTWLLVLLTAFPNRAALSHIAHLAMSMHLLELKIYVRAYVGFSSVLRQKSTIICKHEHSIRKKF